MCMCALSGGHGIFEQGMTKMGPLFWETTQKLGVFSLASRRRGFSPFLSLSLSLSVSETTCLVLFGGSREIRHDSLLCVFLLCIWGGERRNEKVNVCSKRERAMPIL